MLHQGIRRCCEAGDIQKETDRVELAAPMASLVLVLNEVRDEMVHRHKGWLSSSRIDSYKKDLFC
jgi:hypothetical protein